MPLGNIKDTEPFTASTKSRVKSNAGSLPSENWSDQHRLGSNMVFTFIIFFKKRTLQTSIWDLCLSSLKCITRKMNKMERIWPQINNGIGKYFSFLQHSYHQNVRPLSGGVTMLLEADRDGKETTSLPLAGLCSLKKIHSWKLGLLWSQSLGLEKAARVKCQIFLCCFKSTLDFGNPS